ncbi:MAG TPA: flagellar biosynthetic protein FliR, partial [Alphaproteobacteria bacterium]|nr:flagellar biosynthetic protein FliR [Alphaproteobacteria bacterium]
SYSVKFRLMFAFVFSACLKSIDVIPPLSPQDPISYSFFQVLLVEILVGFCLGILPKIALILFDILTQVISFNTSFSNAMIFNPSQGIQNNVLSTYLTLGLSLIMLSFNVHHLFLKGLVASYDVFPFSKGILFTDMSPHTLLIVQEFFAICMRLSFPFLLSSILLQLLLGLLNRTMPQLQVFFLAQPLQILLGLALLFFCLYPLLMGFGDFFEQRLPLLVLGS